MTNKVAKIFSDIIGQYCRNCDINGRYDMYGHYKVDNF